MEAGPRLSFAVGPWGLSNPSPEELSFSWAERTLATCGFDLQLPMKKMEKGKVNPIFFLFQVVLATCTRAPVPEHCLPAGTEAPKTHQLIHGCPLFTVA